MGETCTVIMGIRSPRSEKTSKTSSGISNQDIETSLIQKIFRRP
jgi:hypothetical protein